MSAATVTKENGLSAHSGAVIRTKGGDVIAHPGGRVRHGRAKSLLRMLLCALYFAIDCLTIVATQVLISPLWFFDRALYYAAVALTKQMFGIVTITVTQWWAPTLIRISGDASIQRQLSQSSDGSFETSFPERIVLIANHQLYTDWLYLWWIAYTSRMHGYLYIILKDTLRMLPVLGQGMMFYDFIFLSRKWAIDQGRLSRAMRHLTTLTPGRYLASKTLDPMWLLIFPEGTTLSRNGRNKSAAWAKKQSVDDMRHLLLPRSTGLYECLKGLRGSIDWIYDCTIAYEGIPDGQFGEEIFTIWSTYFERRPPKSVNMYWRRFALASIPLETSEEFADWLQKRWDEKDLLLEGIRKTGRFPPNETSTATGLPGHPPNPAFIDTEVRLRNWTEVAKIFTPLMAAGLLLGLALRMKNRFV